MWTYSATCVLFVYYLCRFVCLLLCFVFVVCFALPRFLFGFVCCFVVALLLVCFSFVLFCLFCYFIISVCVCVCVLVLFFCFCLVLFCCFAILFWFVCVCVFCSSCVKFCFVFFHLLFASFMFVH